MSLFHLPTIRLPAMHGYKFQKGRGGKFFLARRWEPMNADNSQDAADIVSLGAEGRILLGELRRAAEPGVVIQ